MVMAAGPIGLIEDGSNNWLYWRSLSCDMNTRFLLFLCSAQLSEETVNPQSLRQE